MTQRIAICWTFSVGKSTLIDRLETKLHKISELERDIPEENKNTLIFNEIKDNEYGWDKFITANSYIDNLAYFQEFEPEKISELDFQTDYNIIFYVKPELPIEDDWYRYTSKKLQKSIDKRIKEIIKDKNYITLSWTVEERLDIIYKTLANDTI